MTVRFLAPVSSDELVESVPVQADGDYEHALTGTLEIGTWTVRVSYQGQGTGQATFEVDRRLHLVALAEELEESVRRRSEEIVRALEDALAAYPTFPRKDELEEKLEATVDDLARLAAVLDHFHVLARALAREVVARTEEPPEEALVSLARAASAADRTRRGLASRSEAIDRLGEWTRRETEWRLLAGVVRRARSPRQGLKVHRRRLHRHLRQLRRPAARLWS